MLGGASMKLPRRHFLHLAAGAAALPALPRNASALDYPTRPVHMIVGFPPGNASDIVTRLMAQSLAERLRAAIHRREPAGSQRQYWHRSRRASPTGRLHTAHDGGDG